MRTLAFAAFLLPAAAMATVHTNGIVNGATDWCAAASYGDGVVPSAGDVVVVSNGFVATVADAASMAKVSSLSQILPEGSGKVVFDVPEGEVWTNNAAFSKGISMRGGCMYKTGLGELCLNSYNKLVITVSGTSSSYDYFASNITVAAGTLALRQKGGNYQYYYNNVDVAKDSKLVLNTKGGTPTSGTTYMDFQKITGEGEVYQPGPAYIPLRISGNCTFAGKLTGDIQYFSSGRVMLTGTNSTCSSVTPRAYGGNKTLLSAGGVTGLAKIGKKNEPSSIGGNVALAIADKGGGYLYLGEGETTDKNIELDFVGDTNACPPFFDAGAVGNVLFTGRWGLRNNGPDYPWIQPFVLAGSNTCECVISNYFCGYTGYGKGFWTLNGTNYAFNIVKRGSGAWRLAYNPNQFAGGYSIDEGTLRYNTIDETNLVSCLGKGGAFYDDSFSKEPWKHKVDYCFRLGNENISGLDKTEGTLEYTGVQGASAGTRTFALKGHGRLLNNTATRVRYTGFTSISDGDHVLTLDGTGLNTNMVYNVYDGTGTVSIAKTGGGTWGLGGDTAFSGSLDVRGGTLLVYSAPTNYTWFLWTIRALGKPQQIVQVGQFGLYDADGKRLNEGLAYNDGDHSALDPGQVGYRSHYGHYYYNTGRTPDNMFVRTQVGGNGWMTMPMNGSSGTTPKVDDPTTWLRVVMRLSDEDAVVDSYDLYFNNGPYKPEVSTSYGHINPKNYTVYGSTDGLNWDVLHDVQDNLSDDPALNGGMPIPADKAGSATYWVATSNAWNSADATYHKGFRISGSTSASRPKPLCNVSTVSVSDGGVLKCAASEKIELSSVTVDCTAEEGTIDGFTLAESGTLSVKNYTRPSKGDVELPIRFENVDGLQDVAQWGLKINGKRSVYGIEVKDGKVRVVAPGILLLVR